MRAHAKYDPGDRPSVRDMATIWALVGVEVGRQLLKRRGVRLEGVGTVVLTSRGVVLQRERRASEEAPGEGARPGAALGLAAVAAAAGAAGVERASATRGAVAETARRVLAELVRCGDRRQVGRLALRPVGCLYSRAASREADEGVGLAVDAAFRARTARAWDANVRAGAPAYGGARRGFRGDDRALSDRRARGAPPAYETHRRALKPKAAAVGAGAAAAALRRRAVAAHGPDGLCVLARCLRAAAAAAGGVDAGVVEHALRDGGVDATAAEAAAALGDARTCRAAEKALAAPGALSEERRAVIDAAWAELAALHAFRADAAVRGARRDGSAVSGDAVPLALLRERVDGDWHAHVRGGLAPEDAVVAKLLGHLEVAERTGGADVPRAAWRACLARLSGAYDDDDAFEADVRACWKLKGDARPRRRAAEDDFPVPPTRTAWAAPPPRAARPPRDDDDVAAAGAGGARARGAGDSAGAGGAWAYGAADPAGAGGLESAAAVAALDDLRKLVYEPPCGAGELRRRLGASAAGDDALGEADLAARLRSRAAALRSKLGGRGARRLAAAAVDAAGRGGAVAPAALGRALAAFFGGDADARRADARDPLRRLRADCGALRRALRAAAPAAALDADRAAALFADAGLRCTAQEARDVVAAVARRSGGAGAAVALGERAAATPREIVAAARRGGMGPRRAALVARVFDVVSARGGTELTARTLAHQYRGAAPAKLVADFGGTRARVDRAAFVEYYEDVSPTVDGDFHFAAALGAAWDVAPWPSAADENADPDDDDDDSASSRGSRAGVVDRFW